MPERVNRRDQIVDVAADLFISSGYKATSVRQISDAVGCTEAAIYYHFKDKRALLQEVVECRMPDFFNLIEEIQAAESLDDLIHKLQVGLVRMNNNQERIQRIRWMLAEFPNLSPEEQTLFHNKHLRFHEALSTSLARFMDDETKADSIAWTCVCAGFGYTQLFHNVGLDKHSDFNIHHLVDNLIRLMR